MASAEIPFPSSTAPGLLPTENGGRVINAYAEAAPVGGRSPVLWRRSPGLTSLLKFADEGIPRGALAVGGILYAVIGNNAYSITRSGSTFNVTQMSGTIPGSGLVMMARNMRAPTPQILIQHDIGLSQISGTTVSDFSDSDLPATNSLTFIDGYFVWTTGQGRAYSSGLNDVTVNENDYVTAEASVDGLVRAIAMRQDLLLMGETTVEFWSNVGNPTGFPFTRSHVLPVGLLAAHAVAGQETGFPAPLIWVGNDRCVYRLEGYSHNKVSTPAIERMLSGLVSPFQLEASVFVAAGHACWALTSPNWTLVYDMTTGEWHERKSYGRENWRASIGVNAFGEWITFDAETGEMFAVDDRNAREGDRPLIWELRSAQMHRFPGRFRINMGSFDFATGVGLDRGISPIETNPRVSISWSDDGGVTFGNPLLRELGSQGERRRIDVYRTGLTGREGRQWRLQVSDPVEVVFMGGAVELDQRAG